MKLITDKMSRLNVKIFPFAYSLIYDELQAQQLIIDSITIFIGKNQSQLEDFLDEKDEMSKRLKWFEIEKEIFKNVFQIATRRFDQVRTSLTYEDDDAAFYSLSLIQRSVLFLKFKTNFDEPDILDILNLDYVDYRQLEATSELNFSNNFNGSCSIISQESYVK